MIFLMKFQTENRPSALGSVTWILEFWIHFGIFNVALFQVLCTSSWFQFETFKITFTLSGPLSNFLIAVQSHLRKSLDWKIFWLGKDFEDLKDFEIGNPLSQEIRIFGGNQKWDFWPQEKHRATLNAVQHNHLEH